MHIYMCVHFLPSRFGRAGVYATVLQVCLVQTQAVPSLQLGMHVCGYVCVCMCMYVCLVYVCMHMCVCVYVYVCICM